MIKKKKIRHTCIGIQVQLKKPLECVVFLHQSYIKHKTQISIHLHMTVDGDQCAYVCRISSFDLDSRFKLKCWLYNKNPKNVHICQSQRVITES